jgi:DNA-binding transcriptional regulator YdaS (Cro superfamily)
MASDDTAHTRTLKRAVEVAGSPDRLAEALGVALPDLLDWMSGARPLATEVYLRALDVVARGALPKG